MATGRRVIGAIDFGTTYSGYAYCVSDTSQIYVNSWSGAGAGLPHLKAPTTLLLDPDRKFHSFGYEAENKYSELANEDKHHDWFYFRRFKMELYETKLSKTSMLHTYKSKDKQMPALTVFQMAIKYMKDQLIQYVKNTRVKKDIAESDFHWVLTVPAIWSDEAKQFMREAAKQAGIADDRLQLALEPEAASLYCMQTPSQHFQEGGKPSLEPLSPWQRYIVADLGGGTVDISTLKLTDRNSLWEIHPPTGNSLGGTTVDEEFLTFMSAVFGQDCMDQLKEHYRSDYLDFQRAFEGAKRKVCEGSSTGDIEIDIPQFALEEILSNDRENSTESPIARRIMESEHANNIECCSDRIKIETSVMQSFFNRAVGDLIKILKGIVVKHKVKVIFLVGGFSASRYLKERVYSQLPEVKVLIPAEASLAVLKGAVMMGQNPMTITQRISRFTYGIATTRPFVESDPVSLKVEKNGKTYCNGVFRKILNEGDSVKTGTLIPYELNTVDRVTSGSVAVCRSSQADPRYITEADCIGVIPVKAPATGWPSNAKIKVSIVVGEEEFKVHVEEAITGWKDRSIIDFLTGL